MNEITFSQNLLFFWVKGQVKVDSRFVKTNISNTILDFIPAGKDQQNIPLNNISGSMISSRFLIKPILIGLFVMLIGFGSMSDNFFLALILMAIGLGVAGNGILTTLTIEKAGRPYYISVPFYEKEKLQVINEQIQYAISDSVDKTDLGMYFDKKDTTV